MVKSSEKATRLKLKLAEIQRYKEATSAGVKAGISTKFNKAFNEDIKSYIEKPKKERKKKLVKKPKKSISFEQKEITWGVPPKLNDLIEEQNKRIRSLENEVKLLISKLS